MWLVAVSPGGRAVSDTITLYTNNGTLGLTAIPTGPTSVELNWANVYDNSTTTYDLWYSTDGITFAPYATTTATSLAVTGLQPSTVYWFRLRMLSANGGGGTSFADPIVIRV
jgi:hypothetical protein